MPTNPFDPRPQQPNTNPLGVNIGGQYSQFQGAPANVQRMANTAQPPQAAGFSWSDPTVLSALFGLGGTVAAGVMGAKQQNATNALTQQMNAEQLAEQRRQFDLQFGQSQAGQGLAATQMNPFSQLQARQDQALRAAMMSGFQPSRVDGAHMTGGMANMGDIAKGVSSFYGPDAMSAAEQAFHQTASNASPQYTTPNYYQSGYQPGQGGLNANTPIGSKMPQAGGGVGAPSYNSQDPASVDAFIAYMARQPGVNPSVANDPGYWRSKMLAPTSAGGLGPDASYVAQKMMVQDTPGGSSGNGFGWQQGLGLGMTGLGVASQMGAFGKGASSVMPGASSIMGGASGASQAANVARTGMGTANMIGGPVAIGAGIASQYMPSGMARGAMSGFSTGASIGSMVPGVGTLIGGGIGAAIGAVRGYQNDAKEQRDKFAKNIGFGTAEKLYEALNQLGPVGQQLTDTALHVIGKHDTKGNTAWMEQVYNLIKGGGQAQTQASPQAPTYQQPTLGSYNGGR